MPSVLSRLYKNHSKWNKPLKTKNAENSTNCRRTYITATYTPNMRLHNRGIACPYCAWSLCYASCHKMVKLAFALARFQLARNNSYHQHESRTSGTVHMRHIRW